MTLLPKSSEEFGKKKYWDSFFTKRGEKSFEWYGEYPELCGILHKYIKATDGALVVGCGNSNLSADLYDVGGCRSITNIDNSDVVIQRMKRKNDQQRPLMTWLTMDAKKMEFKDSHFSVVLDKGTLDAIMTDESPEVEKSVEEILSEIERVLRFGGRYIVVSLLQKHIAKKLLSWCAQRGWAIRIHRCLEAEAKSEEQSKDRVIFPVFIIVCTKLKKMTAVQPIIENCVGGEMPVKVSSEEMALDILAVQDYAFLRHRLSQKNLKIDENISLQLCDECGKTRYTLNVVDAESMSLINNAANKFAIFIVPQGRETEWLFASAEGMKQLAESAGFERLVVVHLNREQTYENLDRVKSELSQKVMELAPPGFNHKIQAPFLSVGDDLGTRIVRHRGASEASGEYVVEDICVDVADIFRRLIFLNNPNVIQSEVKLVNRRDSNDKSKRSKKNKGKVKMEDETATIDRNYLSCQHHLSMITGLTFLNSNLPINDTTAQILLIGLGGGGLPLYLRKHFPKVFVEVLEIDPEVVQLATKWFGFAEDERLRVTVTDGLKYLSENADRKKFDAIMLDVDSKDSTVGMSCPPAAFVENQMLETMKSILKPQGLLIINLVCRDPNLRLGVLSNVGAIFPSILFHKIDGEVNEILYAIREKWTKIPKKFKGRMANVKFENKQVESITKIIQELKIFTTQ